MDIITAIIVALTLLLGKGDGKTNNDYSTEAKRIYDAKAYHIDQASGVVIIDDQEL